MAKVKEAVQKTTKKGVSAMKRAVGNLLTQRINNVVVPGLYAKTVEKIGRENVAIVFGSNLSIKKDGSNVMGAGLAKQIKERIPGIDKAHGEALMKFKGVQQIWPTKSGTKDPIIIAFPVKRHWSEDGNTWLIEKSCHELKAIASANKEMTFLWAFPAIGNGKLQPKDVIKIIQKVEMPSNVVLVTKKNPFETEINEYYESLGTSQKTKLIK